MALMRMGGKGQPQVLHTCLSLWYTTSMPTPRHVQLPSHLPDYSPDSTGLHRGDAHACECQTDFQKAVTRRKSSKWSPVLQL